MSVMTVTASNDCPLGERCEELVVDGISEAEITAYPAPDVETLFVDDSLLYDRLYEQVTNAVNILDAPNGSIISSLDKGFNFVTTIRTQDGWAEINPGQWVNSENLENSGSVISKFSGVLLPDAGLPYPMAWILVNLYPSNTPGGEPSEEHPIIWRYTRVNLYAAVEVDGTNWYQIGVDQWVHQFHVGYPHRTPG
jgi:hypothetical protein